MARPARKARSGGTQARPGRSRGGGGGSGGRPRGPVPLTGPPPGTYDPALDYQLRASRRGLADLLETTHKENQRSRLDYRTGRRISGREHGRDLFDLRQGFREGNEDLGFERGQLDLSFSRDLTDLATARQRGEEDYDRTLANLQRTYAAQAFRHEESALAATGGDAGTTEAGGRVRTANQAYDKGAIDLSHLRSVEDLAREEARRRQDYGTDIGQLDLSLARLGEHFNTSMGRTNTDFLTNKRVDRRQFRRGLADRSEKLSRARREQGLYEPSVIQQEYYQAHQFNPHIRFPSPASYGGLSGRPASGPRRGRRRRRSGGVTAP